MNEQEQMMFFYEIFSPSLNRLGPGSDKTTRKAIQIVKDSGLLPDLFNPSTPPLSILDVGCGTGKQTFVLAKDLNASITAIDNHQPFLDELSKRSIKQGVADKIDVIQMDMNNITYTEKSFDMIWAEGSLFILGLENAVEKLKPLLKDNGILAFSDLLKFRQDVPEECADHLKNNCLVTLDRQSCDKMILENGCEIIDSFILPKEDWLEEFYDHLEQNVMALKKLNVSDPDRMNMLDSAQYEIDMYRKYNQYYGYVFYIVKFA